MSEAFHLYVISFTVGKEAGLAMVAAQGEKSAFQILKNSGSRYCGGYSLVQIRDIGMTSSCSYGLLMESFVNAREAYDAIISAFRNIRVQGSTSGMSPEDKEKLDSIEFGANVNVQPDWNANSGDAYIRNKPNIPDSMSDIVDDVGLVRIGDIVDEV